MFGGQAEIMTKKEKKSQIMYMYICMYTVDQQADPEKIIRKDRKSGLNWNKKGNKKETMLEAS